MKKTRTLNPAVYSVVIVAMALLLGSGIIAGLEKSALLSVSAGENAGVSDGDISNKSGDTVSPGDNTKQTVFRGGAKQLRAYADPELVSFIYHCQQPVQALFYI